MRLEHFEVYTSKYLSLIKALSRLELLIVKGTTFKSSLLHRKRQRVLLIWDFDDLGLIR